MVSHEMTVKMLTGTAVTEHLTTLQFQVVNWRSTSKMAHFHDYWQESLDPHCVGLSIGYLSILTTWKLASLRASNLRARRKIQCLL